jgi:3-hydroxyacyl-CoA dehydrogenase
MPIGEIKKVCFVGSGTMGCFNSIVSAIAGYEVSLYDLSEEALKNSEERQRT